MNPEIKKLRERTSSYLKDHPQYANYSEPHVPRRKKRFTKKRLPDGAVCAYCGRNLTRQNATYDHVIPLSRGGEDSSENLVWCCNQCNRSKGNLLVSEWYDNSNIF